MFFLGKKKIRLRLLRVMCGQRHEGPHETLFPYTTLFRSGVITDLEQDILECKLKWALGSITTNKASGGDGLPVELFLILKDDALKVQIGRA